MVRKPDIQYVHEFYVHGSEAKVLELKPKRRAIKTILPKMVPDRSIRIGVDPVALGGIVVAVALMIMMFVGFAQYIDAYNDNLTAMNQVIDLQNANIVKQHTYEDGYTLEDIQQKALALGMIPISEAEVLYIDPVVPERAPDPTLWENISWFVNGLFA